MNNQEGIPRPQAAERGTRARADPEDPGRTLLTGGHISIYRDGTRALTTDRSLSPDRLKQPSRTFPSEENGEGQMHGHRAFDAFAAEHGFGPGADDDRLDRLGDLARGRWPRPGPGPARPAQPALRLRPGVRGRHVRPRAEGRARRRAGGHPRPARRGAHARLPDHHRAHRAQRRRLATEPRLRLPDPAGARGPGPGHRRQVGGPPGVQPHRRGPGRRPKRPGTDRRRGRRRPGAPTGRWST